MKLKTLILSLLIVIATTMGVFAACEGTVNNSTHGTCRNIDEGASYCWYVCSDGSMQAFNKKKAAQEIALDESAF